MAIIQNKYSAQRSVQCTCVVLLYTHDCLPYQVYIYKINIIVHVHVRNNNIIINNNIVSKISQ